MDKNLKRIIIIVVMIIVIIILALLIIKFKQPDNKPQNQISLGDEGENIDYSSTGIEDVTDKINYFTVRNYINIYLNSLNTNNSIFYIANEYDEDFQKEYVYSLLSSEYIKNKNLTTQNLFKTLNKVSEPQVFIPTNMKVIKKENVEKYLAYGIVQNTNNKFIKKMYIFVNFDIKNKTYSIEPITENYNSIEEVKFANNNVSIEANYNNVLKYQEITDEYVANEYLVMYKKLALSNPESLYDMIDNNYRNARFGTLENFKAYVSQNKDVWSNINMKKYLVNRTDDYIEYVAQDQFENIYIFDDYIKSLKVSFKLDTYTIPTDKFKESYGNASNEKKVQMNIDKFIQMINRQDYKTSYGCLDDTFKKNNYSTESKFSDFMKNNLFKFNKLTFKNFEDEGNDLYSYQIELTDKTGESKDTKEVTIIMKIEDDLNFKMSFSM